MAHMLICVVFLLRIAVSDKFSITANLQCSIIIYVFFCFVKCFFAFLAKLYVFLKNSYRKQYFKKNTEVVLFALILVYNKNFVFWCCRLLFCFEFYIIKV